MITRIFNHQAKTTIMAAFILGSSALLSRFLGLARDMLITAKFGASQTSDIYYAAFRIPDFVYNILIGGGISVAFLPLFSEYFKARREEWSKEAQYFTNNVLNCFLFLLIVMSLVLAVFTPLIIEFIVPGFDPDAKAITINLTRIMFLSPILFGLSSIFSGILQYFDRFLIYSIAPLLYNLGIIFGILFLVPLLGIYGLGWGVILGAGMYFLIQVPSAIMSGFKYKFILDFKHSGIGRIFKLMGPRIIGVAADNINLLVITALASTLAVGSISVFNYANNFQYFPVGIIGISFAVSSFPVFSRYMANGQKKEFFSHFSSVFRQIVFLIIPTSLLLFLLRAQIIRLLYGRGRFDWEDTRLTAAALGIFCFGILAASLIPLVGRAFFSFQNTKTPVLIGITSVILNISFAWLFIFLLKSENFFRRFLSGILKLEDIKNIEVIALPLAISLTALIQLILLLLFLYREIGDFGVKEIIASIKNLVIPSLVLIVSTYSMLYLLSLFVNMRTGFGVLIQTFFAGLTGIIFYLLTSFLEGSQELKIITRSLRRAFG